MRRTVIYCTSFITIVECANRQLRRKFENRIRLTLEVVEAVQTEWPSNLPLFVRISATDWADGGWNAENR
jgi:hypothetical protein